MTAVLDTQPPKMMRLYKLPSGSGKYVFGSLLGADGKPKYPALNGKVVNFVAGRYLTDDPREIEELDYQIENGYTQIVIDPREKEVDSRYNDPVFRLKEQLKEQILRELAATDKTRDMGKYAQGGLNAATSETIAPTAAGGANIPHEVIVNAAKSRLAALGLDKTGE